MKFFQYILVASLICTFIFQSGCDNKDKWKAVPLKITKHESFNYSEMISGDLDSTEKAGLEAAKEKTAQELEGNPKRKSDSSSKSNSKETSLMDTIWTGIKNMYDWFIDLF